MPAISITGDVRAGTFKANDEIRITKRKILTIKKGLKIILHNFFIN
ncbi:hypothetical protein TPE_2493 [Treponema pedis str. T A4]|uniref:Uncharacterized protein n=1 Tax=Treponema pedis str. T A4 TaxID=1291379 RepID=S5ZWZ4_9SPIR|nr:hypothetical protein TPE_2493 [Treponema pedis str. T A4]